MQRYRQRISGPLLDRIDLHLEVPPVTYQEISQSEPCEPSANIRVRVEAARSRQMERLGRGSRGNARMRPREIRQHCVLNSACVSLLQSAVQALNLSARAYDRILKVARTIADLEACDAIAESHLQEAIGYRTLDREVWK